MFSNELHRAASQLVEHCRKKGITITTAESCTGGLLGGLITEIPGASDVYRVGFISYSNKAKTAQLSVDEALINEHGAVSDHVAAAMAQGARDRSKADVAVSITGIAGPGGGTPDKPVGLVYIAVASAENIIVENAHFQGDRSAVRQQSLAKAIAMADDMVGRSFSQVA